MIISINSTSRQGNVPYHLNFRWILRQDLASSLSLPLSVFIFCRSSGSVNNYLRCGQSITEGQYHSVCYLTLTLQYAGIQILSLIQKGMGWFLCDVYVSKSFKLIICSLLLNVLAIYDKYPPPPTDIASCIVKLSLWFAIWTICITWFWWGFLSMHIKFHLKMYTFIWIFEINDFSMKINSGDR